MAYFTSAEFKQNGANILKTDANMIALVKGAVKADSYATIMGKVIASTAFAAADVTFAANGQDLRATFAAKSGITPSGSALITDDVSIIVYSTTTSKVHLCVDAADRAFNNTDPINLPSFTYDIKDPVAA